MKGESRPTMLWRGFVVAACLFALSNCGGLNQCSSGRCRLGYAASGCLTKQAYSQLTEELAYVNETRDTTRIMRLYIEGLCKSFPEGTVVFVLDPGVFTAKVRYTNLPDEPDRWMSAEALR